jgi:hypothetical protein
MERRKGGCFCVSISPEGGWREGLDLEGGKGGKINKKCKLERYAINQQEKKSLVRERDVMKQACEKDIASIGSLLQE